MTEVLYLSWGGSGRTKTIRRALERAGELDAALVYLAVLDSDHFGDLNTTMSSVVEQELHWLLEAQLDLTKDQVGQPERQTRVIVRKGNVLDLAVETAKGAGVDEILIGSPVPTIGSLETAAQVAAELSSQTDLPTMIL